MQIASGRMQLEGSMFGGKHGHRAEFPLEYHGEGMGVTDSVYKLLLVVSLALRNSQFNQYNCR
jgi:hypothetical protein